MRSLLRNMTTILFALSPQVQSLHHHLVHFISRRRLSMHHGARPHLLRAICRRKDGLTVGDGVPPFLAPPSQRAAIFGWREIRNADQRPARSCARLLDLRPHRQADRAIIETSERELRDPLAAFAHLVSRTLVPLSRSEQSAARIRSYRPHAGPLSMPMPQTDTEGVRVGEREAIYAQKEPNVANERRNENLLGFGGFGPVGRNYDRDEISPLLSPQKGRPRLSRARLCDARGGTVSESTSSPRPPVQNARPTNRRSTRESPSSFLDTDCLLNFTTLCPLRLRRRRRRGHLSLCASQPALCESRFHLINFRFLHISSSSAEFARFFIRSRQRHKTATTAAMQDWISLRFFSSM